MFWRLLPLMYMDKCLSQTSTRCELQHRSSYKACITCLDPSDLVTFFFCLLLSLNYKFIKQSLGLPNFIKFMVWAIIWPLVLCFEFDRTKAWGHILIETQFLDRCWEMCLLAACHSWLQHASLTVWFFLSYFILAVDQQIPNLLKNYKDLERKGGSGLML